MSKIPTNAVLVDMLASAERIVAIHARGDSLQGPVHANESLAAVLYNFVIVGEAAARLGPEFHAKHSRIPWRRIIDHRNYMAHGYDTVDSDTLVETIATSLPPLIVELKELLSQSHPPPHTGQE